MKWLEGVSKACQTSSQILEVEKYDLQNKQTVIKSFKGVNIGMDIKIVLTRYSRGMEPGCAMLASYAKLEVSRKTWVCAGVIYTH